MDTGFSASISGIQAAFTRHDVTAHDVANINTPGFSQSNVNQTDMLPAGTRIASITKTPNPSTEYSNTDLAQETGEQIMNKETNAANIATIKVKDRMLGDLLDLVA